MNGYQPDAPAGYAGTGYANGVSQDGYGREAPDRGSHGNAADGYEPNGYGGGARASRAGWTRPGTAGYPEQGYPAADQSTTVQSAAGYARPGYPAAGYDSAGYAAGAGHATGGYAGGAGAGYGRGQNESGRGGNSVYDPWQQESGRAQPGYAAAAAEFLPMEDEVSANGNESGTPRPYGRLCIFTLLDDKAAEFDRVAELAAEGVRTTEPDTLVYVLHVVPKAPMQRIIYEIYRDREAFESHERQPHIQRFVADRRSCVIATNVIDLRLKYAKVAALGAAPAPATPMSGQETQLDRAAAPRASRAAGYDVGYPGGDGRYPAGDQYAAAQYQPPTSQYARNGQDRSGQYAAAGNGRPQFVSRYPELGSGRELESGGHAEAPRERDQDASTGMAAAYRAGRHGGS